MKKIYSIFKQLLDEEASIKFLLLASCLLLFFALGSRELWTQEWRWANISWNMIYSGDYFHPILAGAAYYDKPLLSYWMMILFSHLVGGLNDWALRLPSALAGLLAIWSTYRIGSVLVNRQMGLIAGWMLATSYFFIFWARTANADMLNLAGILLAIQWYFEHKEHPSFFNYSIFFLILSVTALLKGLIGVVIPVIALLPDLLKNKQWKNYLNIHLFLALFLPILIYLSPFIISSHFGNHHEYSENGLYEVYRENILRYFSPFDHEGPIYTYLIYLPLYMMPWAIFLIPALAMLSKRWSKMNSGARWTVWSTLLIFLFLTLSGSRRNYYVLPLVPFAILMTADWLASVIQQKNSIKLFAGVLGVGFSIAFMSFCVIQPLYYSGGGVRPFSQKVKLAATKIQPWSNWNIVFLDARSKITLYLNPARPIMFLGQPTSMIDQDRKDYTSLQLVTTWPIILNPPANTIFISRELYLNKLTPYFKNYQVVVEPLSLGERFLPSSGMDKAIAFIPNDMKIK